MSLEDDEPIYVEPPDIDDAWPQDDWPPVPPVSWPGGVAKPGVPRQGGVAGAPGFSVWLAAAVAVVAAAVGITAGLLLVRGTPIADGARQAATAPGASAPGASAPGASAPASAGGAGLSALPALSGPGGGQQLMLTGRVLAISGTSITIGGNGPSVTATITRSTKVTGAVRGIGGVRAGAEVSAQITGTVGHLTATAIQDPAA